jgi:hypothetical protein
MKFSYITIYEQAASHICMTMQLHPSEFLIYEENLIFFFISVVGGGGERVLFAQQDDEDYTMC